MSRFVQGARKRSNPTHAERVRGLFRHPGAKTTPWRWRFRYRGRVSTATATTTAAEARAAAHRSRLIVVAVLAALVLVIAAIWGTGGFDQRRDLTTEVEPGTLLTVGPYELSFSRAVAQHVKDDDSYEVQVIGTGRTTAQESMGPSTFNSLTVLQDPATLELTDVDRFLYGPGGGSGIERHSFTPGLPATPFIASFRLDRRPDPQIKFFVVDLEFSDTSILKDQGPSWHSVNRAWRMIFPVKELPERDY